MCSPDTGRIYITYVRSKPLHAFVKSSETTEFYSKRHSRKTVKNLDLALAEIEQKRAVIKVFPLQVDIDNVSHYFLSDSCRMCLQR